jgi:hypothetical protein
MSSLRRLWDDSRTLLGYLLGTAAVVLWTASGRLPYGGFWGRICRTAFDVWEA